MFVVVFLFLNAFVFSSLHSIPFRISSLYHISRKMFIYGNFVVFLVSFLSFSRSLVLALAMCVWSRLPPCLFCSIVQFGLFFCLLFSIRFHVYFSYFFCFSFIVVLESPSAFAVLLQCAAVVSAQDHRSVCVKSCWMWCSAAAAAAFLCFVLFFHFVAGFVSFL